MIRYSPCSDRLAGKVALITGSTQGIGLGIARRFAAEGATVVINDEGANDGVAVAEAIEAEAGSDARFVEADVGDPEAVERLVGAVEEGFGRLDVLVNNVADFRHGPMTETSIEDWDDVMSVALRSHWLVPRESLGLLARGASVVNMSSVHAVRTDPDCIPYNVAKSGVNGLTRAMAVDLGPEDVRVNAIMPGKILVE